MKKGSNVYGRMSNSSSSSSSTLRDEDVEWEMRPGGMLVQKRNETIEVPPTILRLRVAYGALRYEISVNSQATFGKIYVARSKFSDACFSLSLSLAFCGGAGGCGK